MEENKEEIELSRAVTKVVLGGDEVEIPKVLTEDRDILQQVMSAESLAQSLTAEEKEKLSSLLPNQTSAVNFNEELQSALSAENERFGVSPVTLMWDKLSSGSLAPDKHKICEQMKDLAYRHYKLGQAHYFVKLLQELVLSRQEVLQRALFAGSLENMWKGVAGGHKKRLLPLEEDEQLTWNKKRKPELEQQYNRILCDIGCADEGEATSCWTSPGAEMEEMSEVDYRRMLRKHRKHRKMHQVSYLSRVERLLERASSSAAPPVLAPPTKKPHQHHHVDDDQWATPPPHASTSRKSSKAEQEVSTSKKEGGGSVRRGRRMMQERCQHERTTAEQAQAIYKVYSPIDKGTMPEMQLERIILDKPLPNCKYWSFFSLLKAVFEPINDKKAELAKVAKNLSHLMRSGECSECHWLEERSDWVELTLSALCYLAAEVGAFSSFSPLPHFIPLIEFRDRIDHWRWIGGGRDSELELYVLCKHWQDNLDKTLPVVDYSDYEPLPPHVWTNSGFVKSSSEELMKFRKMERERYSCPHKAYIYNIRGYESPVGPVKGAKVYKKESGSKARGHALLVPNRPTCVTILSLVRDATSRLPNGEGTRLDLCIQVQDSQYIAESVSETQLNNAVSGALDRLHYEKDPCVRYDGTRKVWIYLHRGRNEEDFERIHWACEVAAKQRKMLMSRPKHRPEVILRVGGIDKVLDVGTGGEDAVKVGRKSAGRCGPTQGSAAVLSATGTVIPTATGPTGVVSSLSSSSSSSLVGLSAGSSTSSECLTTPSTPHSLPQPAQLSMVVASAVQGASSILGPVSGGSSSMDQTVMAGSGYDSSQQKASLQARRANAATNLQEALDSQKSGGTRNRKQSLKMAELLQDNALVPFSRSSVSSLSSGWSSDSEDPAPSPQPRPPALVLGSATGGAKKTEEDDWGSSEGVSPDTSFDDY